MSQPKKYQLISGVFDSSEALSIVMNFYHHKINYHNLQLLTAMEHNEKNNVDLIQQKVKGLENTSNDIRKLLTEHKQQVEVKGFIEIDLDPVSNG